MPSPTLARTKSPARTAFANAAFTLPGTAAVAAPSTGAAIRLLSRRLSSDYCRESSVTPPCTLR